jgi:hypothetical protein
MIANKEWNEKFKFKDNDSAKGHILLKISWSCHIFEAQGFS